MRYAFSFITALFFSLAISAQTKFKAFGQNMVTNAHCLYVNDKLRTNSRRFTFHSVNEALRFIDGKGDATIYIEPSVYWIDNPDDNAVRMPLAGENAPFGMKVRMSDVRLVGLSANAEDVVLACNRGQTQGALGNFTMFFFDGNNIKAENITFGNYCNVDLIYPLNTLKNRKKRADAVVQAQLVICNGDNYTIRNCRFISRLNLCPFVGARHVDFTDCYFECTDDALCGTGTYNHCTFTLYSSKPFYSTSRLGATLIDCDIHAKTSGTQYLTKVSGPITLRNCRWTSDDPSLKIEWTKNPNPKDKCYMIDCTLNGKPLIVPTTPDVPMPVSLPLLGLSDLTTIAPGRWTLDAYAPTDVKEYLKEVDRSRPAWVYGEGMDGAEGCYGLIQNVKGARMMYTGLADERYNGQVLSMGLDPCKAVGQGFGSATGQYLDVCIKFDTQTLTGFGIRFTRTPKYDHAVEVMLVEYNNGNVTILTEPEKCVLFKRGCYLEIKNVPTEGSSSTSILTATIRNNTEEQVLSTTISRPISSFGGIQIQHTGSTGASAVVIRGIHCVYL